MSETQIQLIPNLLPEMTPHERRIREMMLGFKQATPFIPQIPDAKTRTLRVRLLIEEVLEFARDAGVLVSCPVGVDGGYVLLKPEMAEAKGDCKMLFDATDDPKVWEAAPEMCPNLELMADALSDTQVVLTGAFVACGLRSAPLLELTDGNNLMKIANGKTNPETGKFEKDKNHPAPNYVLALALQGYGPAKRKLAGLPPDEAEIAQSIFRAGQPVPKLSAALPMSTEQLNTLNHLRQSEQAEEAVQAVHRQPGTNMPSKVQMPTSSSGFNMEPQQPDEARYDGPYALKIVDLIRRGQMAAALGILNGELAPTQAVKEGSMRVSPPGGPTAVLFRIVI